jgi:eukaryotic-like serine/threonine-protein kinase
MPASSDKLSALAEANRRYARLAISWFAVDASQVETVLRAVQEGGENVDVLDALVAAEIITPTQAENLRLDLAPTQVYSPPGPLDYSADPPTKSVRSTNGAPAQIGPYRILRLLGQGGMGAVYLGFDGKENRQVAVKVLSAELAPKQNVLRRFQLEGKHGAMLVHPNIVRSFDMGLDPDTELHYIVLEYVDGPSAHELLDRAGKLQIGDAVHIILDIARALEHAHKNRIIHRDIKPGNILLASSGLAKLSDLGLAKRRDDSANLTHVSQGIGTPYYMPYEQAMNAKTADERSDIYALGATLFHLVTGVVPFAGESTLEIVEKKERGHYPSARSLNPDVPETLDVIVTRMLARSPADRFQTISEVIVDLERSQLSVPLPSFAKIDSAMQDPVVAKRLTSPIEMTLPDLRVRQLLEEKMTKEREIWHVRYKNPRGTLCKSKTTFADIVARLKSGTLTADADASRSPKGKFKPISQWPEFQAALAGVNGKKPAKRRAAPVAEPAPIPWKLYAIGAIGIGVAVLVAAVYFLSRL